MFATKRKICNIGIALRLRHVQFDQVSGLYNFTLAGSKEGLI